MREFKFRVWDREDDKLYDVKSIDFPLGTISGKDLIIKNGVEYEWRSIKDVVLLQFTGLHDKNGKEIYEGDILQDEIAKGVVEWVQEHCSFLVYVSDPVAYHFMESGDNRLYESEIVGNIYENKDLLGE